MVAIALCENFCDDPGQAPFALNVNAVEQCQGWLDPDTEKAARDLLADNLASRPTCGFCHTPLEGGRRRSHCGAP